MELEFGTNPVVEGNTVGEGADVYFECNIKANPPVYRVAWKHNVSYKWNFLTLKIHLNWALFFHSRCNRQTKKNNQQKENDLHNNPQEGIIIRNQSVVLQNVTRVRIGEYVCIASNSEGDGYSQPVQLNILCKISFNYIHFVFTHIFFENYGNIFHLLRNSKKFLKMTLKTFPDKFQPIKIIKTF